MILEIYDTHGELITTFDMPDDLFHRLEIEAAFQGITVQEHIVNFIHDYAKKVVENESDEA